MKGFKSLLVSMVFGMAAMGLVGAAHASGADHFKGKPSETLEQAVSNFSEYNGKLEKVLAGKLDARALHEVHELTYTLEVALAKINEEFAALADVLEEVHQATERNDAKTTLSKGKEYLDTSRKVVK